MWGGGRGLNGFHFDLTNPTVVSVILGWISSGCIDAGFEEWRIEFSINPVGGKEFGGRT